MQKNRRGNERSTQSQFSLCLYIHKEAASTTFIIFILEFPCDRFELWAVSTLLMKLERMVVTMNSVRRRDGKKHHDKAGWEEKRRERGKRRNRCEEGRQRRGFRKE